MKRIFYLFATAIISLVAHADADVDQATALAYRLSPRLAQKVEFVKINPLQKGQDIYSLTGADNKVVIGGNNANSMAVGLNRYLTHYCHTTVSWYSDIDVDLPAALPNVDRDEQVSARVPQRFFLNYCTYGYTMTFWGWKEWERLIDWMALNGINLPLNITGQEAVWQKVWMKMGMTADETRNYFTGPSYLPWHRMANIDHWCGPLPQEWLDGQVELQQKILERERALNMRPVLPAFAGHVPARLRELFPDADIKQLSPWQEFPEDCLTYFLNSEDPLFAKIQKSFIEEQTALFGTDHIYGFDPFNEVDPPVWDPAYIGRVTKHMYNSLRAVDKKAEWLLMAWFFFYNKNWTAERVKAMMNAVPKGKLTLLDYHCDNTEVWRMRDGFSGQNFLWCYLGNFGGNTVVQGNPKESKARLETALAEAGKNLRGVGSTLEGLDVQQACYEAIFDHVWTTGDSEQDVINNIADRHAGAVNDHARKAWEILYNDALKNPGGNRGELMNIQPKMNFAHHYTKFDAHDDALLAAWRELLQQDSVVTDAMKIDIITIGRQLLDGIFKTEKKAFDDAFGKRDRNAMTAHATLMKELLRDADKLNSYQEYCTLEKWVDLARSLGMAEDVKNYYQMNATRLITTWGGNINDYANRNLNGLISDYYTKRWDTYLDEAFTALNNGTGWDDKHHEARQRAIEDNFKYTPRGKQASYDSNVLAFARLLLKKYFSE